MKTTLVVMAAGLGSRYGGNKQVDGIGPSGEILMQYSIYDAIKAGFDKIVFIIKKEHEEIIKGFCQGIKNAEVRFAYHDYSSIPSFYKIPAERTKPFGTLHAILCARDVINEPFAVINADDYYGREAFKVIFDKLQDLKEGEAAMVAYKVKNTVSENGAVSRGVCKIEDGFLNEVVETHGIVVDAEGVITDGEGKKIDRETPVSMNEWGFLPDIFDKGENIFNEFLKGLSDSELKAEAAIPTAVDTMIKSGALKVFALHTDCEWFGVTYKEDKPEVASKLLELHKNGFYPEKLF